MAYKNTVKDYSQMIRHLTRDKTTDVPGSMAHGLRNMKLAEVPRSEMDNVNTPDLDQGADSILRPGETLEDFDVEFRRPNAQGGVQQLVSNTVDGSRPGYSGREYSSKEFDKFSDDVLKAYAEDDITKMIDPKYKSNINRVKINKYNNLNKLIEKTGLDEETIFNLFDDREAYVELEQKQATTQGRPVEKGKAKFYKQAENWIVKNSKRYADPDKFKKAFIRTFGKDNDIIQKINKPEVLGKRNSTLTSVPFSDWFRTNIMGSSEQAMKGQVKPSYSGKQLNQIFKTAIYTNNENVRNKIINELTNILPEKSSKRTPDIRKKFQSSNILKKFGLNEKIDGPIARLLAKEVGDDLLKQVSLFRKPFLGTTQLINYLKDKVNPKYKSMFEETAKATAFAQKNSWPQARQALNSSNSIMFDHKIPKALIEAGYADEVEYIKLNPASAEFNAKIKNSQFDKPMIKLTNEFERTKSLDGKAKVVEKMNILKNNFSKKYGGYLDEISITADKTGKPMFKSSASPITKKTDLVSSLGKSMFQAGEINQKQVASLLKKLEGQIKPITTIQSKGIAKKLDAAGFKCKLSNGLTCNDPRAYTQSIKENMSKIQQGDDAAIAKLNKLGKGMNAFKGAAKFTGWGLLTELGIAAPLAAVDYAKGANKDEIISNATYGLFGKNQDEQLREKYSDYGQTKDFQKTYDKLLKQESALDDQTGYGPIINPQNIKNTEKKLMEQSKQFDSVLPPSQGLRSEFDLGKFLNMMVTDQQRDKLFADQKAQRKEERGILKPSTGLESYDNFMEGGIASLNVKK